MSNSANDSPAPSPEPVLPTGRSSGVDASPDSPGANHSRADLERASSPVAPPSRSLDATAADPPADGPSLAERVHGSFNKARRAEIPRTLVDEVIRGLALDPTDAPTRAPQLLLRRLVFRGAMEARPDDAASADPGIAFDRTFAPGVNVVLIRGNLRGKSTVLKTIKFALTGDDGDYDAGVRAWIRHVWLQFSLDDAEFTVHLERAEGGLRGYLAGEYTTSGLEEAPRVLFRMPNREAVAATLQQFFLGQFGLAQLEWTQQAAGAVERRQASWKTFFQALLVPDTSDQYLLIPPENAIGGQDNLILSVFLGLRLAEPLNALGVEKNLLSAETRVGEADVARAREEADAAAAELARVEGEVARLEAAQQARRAEFDQTPSRRLFELQSARVAADAELTELERQHAELTTLAQQQRTHARRLREAAALRLHFTGLSVSLCPNCDAGVEPAAIAREESEHNCRLCGKLADGASDTEADALAVQAEGLEAQAEQTAALRTRAAADARAARERLGALNDQVGRVEEVLRGGLAYVLPTDEERAERSRLDQQIGELRARLRQAGRVADREADRSTDVERRIAVLERVRKLLKEDADALNADLLARLGDLTQDLSHRIGVQSISEIRFFSSGTHHLLKHGTRIGFSGIKNPGERLRVKLAFFLAIMRLGRIAHAGRHPGLLLIDQPGSAEMAPEDGAALAKTLRAIDAESASEFQLICFTARPEFADATAPDRVYGPTVGPYAF